MGLPAPHTPVVLIAGLLSAWPERLARAEERLRERFGPVLCATGLLPFDFTDYYRATMGGGLLRKFLAFERMIPPSALATIKRWTNGLEDALADAECPVPRPVNVDPGYLTPAKLVLATTKDHAHRLYLHSGIYAEITLTYHHGAYQPMPWTYPDYRTAAYQEFFAAVRARVFPGRRAVEGGAR